MKTIKFLYLALIVLVTQMTISQGVEAVFVTEFWTPTSCKTSAGVCTPSNVQEDDNTFETFSIKPSGYINGTAWNASVPNHLDRVHINNISVNVRWKDQTVGRGGENQVMRYWNSSHWITCAGPFGETTTEQDTWCVNVEVNFTNITSINAIKLMFYGEDSVGSVQSLNIDLLKVYINYTDRAPQWRNNATNATGHTIDAGKAITLGAQVRNEVNMSMAWLSTNESGSFQNFTSSSIFIVNYTDSTNNKAHYGQESTRPSTGAGTEFTADEYTQVSSSNDARMVANATTAGNYPFQNFVFKVGLPQNISNITVSWEGSGQNTTHVEFVLFLFNYTAGSYSRADSLTQTTVTPREDIRNITIGAEHLYNFVNSTGHLNLRVYGALSPGAAIPSNVSTDYVEAKVRLGTYGSPKIFSAPNGGFYWANFTWMNEAYTQANVSWFVWMNDSRKQENVTDLSWFHIVPAVAASRAFLLMMPAPYAGANYNFTITALTEPSANSTSWVSFNFTLPLPNTLVQPCTLGNCPTDQQDAHRKPIFLIDNIGTVSVDIHLRLNETLPRGIYVMANATCTGCSSATAAPTNLTDLNVTIVRGLPTGAGLANISLWANATVNAQLGETTSNLILNTSTAA